MNRLAEPSPSLIAGLRERYSEPHRVYHTWAHVDALLNHFHAHQDMLSAPTTVLWALYWHDAIYDPTSSDNEQQSAALLREDARNILSGDEIADAVTIIEATAKHAIPDGLSIEMETDTKFFLDIDLSIFGQDSDVFNAYEAAIREEYSFVPEEMFNAGRSALLKGFLSREQLFFTEIFLDRWDAKARDNLKRSISRLTRP